LLYRDVEKQIWKPNDEKVDFQLDRETMDERIESEREKAENLTSLIMERSGYSLVI
jgi:hypothetical protein